MNDELIVVRQLPVIEEQLQQVKTAVEKRVGEVLSMVCTEETRQAVKEARTALNKEFGELEARRKEVKASIMAPYESFEVHYKECISDIYRGADEQLKSRIDEVENGLKKQKTDKVEAYFNEYRQSLGIDPNYVQFQAAKINVTLLASEKSLKTAAKAFLDRVAGDLTVIDVQEHKDEVLVEYLRDLDLPGAIAAVEQRHKAMEIERERRMAASCRAEAKEEAEQQVERIVAEEAALLPPTAVNPPEQELEPYDPAVFSTSFKVTGTMDELRALKKFLIDGGYTYEQI